MGLIAHAHIGLLISINATTSAQRSFLAQNSLLACLHSLTSLSLAIVRKKWEPVSKIQKIRRKIGKNT